MVKTLNVKLRSEIIGGNGNISRAQIKNLHEYLICTRGARHLFEPALGIYSVHISF